MDGNVDTPLGAPGAGRRLSRRRAFRLGAAGAVASAVAGSGWRQARAFLQGDAATPAATPRPGASVALSDAVLLAFEADVEQAMQTFGIVGASVALVEGDRIAYARGFGVRGLHDGGPVTERTRFRIGSNTKSMTSLLVATFVDEGVLAWDDRVVDVWPEFRAPTAELTAALRVRDLMGMATGIAESPTIEFFMSGGGESALDLLHAVPYLPVVGTPGSTFYYNNSLVCVAGYLGSLAGGTAPEALEPASAALVAERVFGPIGMAGAAVAADPRPLGDDYAVGAGRDLFGRPTAVPFISIGGVDPAGGVLASANDMARYLLTQMNGGVAPGGARVVSAANLAETHRPGIVVPPPAPDPQTSALRADLAETRYCLGWLEQAFTDGRRLLWHAGGIDGFASKMGFLPEERFGFVVLTNQDPGGGQLFPTYVESSLLNRLYGLTRDVSAHLAGLVPEQAQRAASLAARTRPVDPAAVAPYLGLYGNGFRLRLEADGVLRLEHDIRSLPLLALDDGGYVVVDGPGVIQQRTVAFADDGGAPVMTIDGFDPVRWLTGG